MDGPSPLGDVGDKVCMREGASFSPAEAVYGTQPIPPGQYLAAEEDPSPSFLSDLQQTLAGRTLLPTSHHSTPAPSGKTCAGPPRRPRSAPRRRLRRTLPGVRAFPPLLQAADRRQSRHCVNSQIEALYLTSRRRGGAATKTWAASRRRAAPLPEVISPPAQGTPPQRAKRCRHVTFRCPAVTPPSSPTQRLHPSGRPARSAGPPRRYMVSRVSLRGPRLGGELWRDDLY